MLSLLTTGCGGGGGGATPAAAPALIAPVVTTSPTFCNGGDVATSTAGDPFFPLISSMKWTYNGTYSDTNIPTATYTNIASVSAAQLVNGTTVTTVTETSPLYQPYTTSYYRVSAQSAQDWGSVAGNNTAVPIDMAVFPLMVGKVCWQDIGNVNFGDVDFDGQNDFGSIQTQVTIAPFENIIVPAGTFINTAKLQVVLTQYVTLSGTGQVLKEVDNITEWRARNVGLVKQTYQANVTGGDSPYTMSATESMANRQSTLALDTNDIIADPVTGSIYASVDSTSPLSPNSIVKINPLTGQIERTIQIQGPPGPLAVSNDSARLYVGIKGSPRIDQIDLATLVLGVPIALPVNGPFGNPTWANDIEVDPNDSTKIAVVLFGSGGPYCLTMYKNGVALPNTSINPNPNLGVFISNISYGNQSNTLYAADDHSSGQNFYVFGVDINGTALISNTPLLLSANADIFFSGGLIYSKGGKIINPNTLAEIYNFFPNTPFRGSGVVADPIKNRVFHLIINGFAYELTSFDATTKLATKTYSYLFANRANTLYASKLIRINTTGLAFPVKDLTVPSLSQITLIHESDL